jgi:enediyne biosynthesis protein E4
MRLLIAAIAAVSLNGVVRAEGEPVAKPLRAPSAPAGETLFTTLSPEQTGITAVNTYDDPRMWNELFREFTLGAVGTGVTIDDYDGDGRPDVFVVNKTSPCRLYRQTGDFQFTDVTEQAGLLVADKVWNTGATFADVNNDGRPDLYVCRFDSPNLLFINQGDGTFKESAKAYGLAVKDASVMASFADYDRDGDLDVYIQTNILNYAAAFKGRPDLLFKNNGNGTFTDVTSQAGIWGPTQGHAAVWWDYNDDGWPDLYAANDFENPDKLYRNNGDGTFTDVIETAAPHTSYSSMGADLGDINNDGRMDFFVSDMAATTHYKHITGIEEMGRGIWEGEMARALCPQYPFNALYLNNGTDRFFEIAHLAGLRATDWTWSVRFADLDNDGYVDLHVTNGMIRNFMDADLLDKQNVAATLAQRAAVYINAPVYREENLAFKNAGDLRFQNVSKAWGLNHNGVSFGAAYADLDRDGDLDVVFSNYEAAPTVVRNDSTSGQRLLIKLAGRSSNRAGIGATVRLRSGTETQVRQLTLMRGLMSSDEPLVHFGLGDKTEAEELEIVWPSGIRQTLKKIKAGQFLTVTEPTSAARPEAPRLQSTISSSSWFKDVSKAVGLAYAGRESHFDEFPRQILLPRRLSIAGPGIAVTQTHEAGAPLHRVYLPGQVYTQGPDRRWTAAALPNPPTAAGLGGLFFHANDDGVVDFYAITGGVAHASGDPALRDALYLGTGDGAWVRAPDGALPGNRDSTGAVAAADYDRDGDLDLFVGARAVPGKYPETPRSLLLRNDSGVFKDVADEIATGLSTVGMVTSAVWSDTDNDGDQDLLVATEWGPVAVFRNDSGSLVNATEAAGLASLTGWWTSITAGDVNGDGWTDYVVGNFGLNTKYRATATHPAVLLAGSLDNTPKQNLIEAYYEDDRLYPVRGRSKMAYAMPFLRRKYKTFSSFASATVDEIFGPEKVAAARRLEARELASGVLVNRNGHFTFQPLPTLAQIAPVFGSSLQDFDGDGKVDLAIAQNFFGPEPRTGRFDGGTSMILRGDGTGAFTAVWPTESGVLVPGDAKALATLDWNGDARPDLLISQNAGALMAYENRGTAGSRGAFAISLRGASSNPDAVGARVTVRYADGKSESREISAGQSHLSQPAATAFFGIGKHAPVEVQVRWPDGTITTHGAPKPGTHTVLKAATQ